MQKPVLCLLLFIVSALFADAAEIAHPGLFYTAAELPALKAKTKDTTINSYGFSTKAKWDSIISTANSYLNNTFRYTATGPGGTTFDYTLSSTPPAHHCANSADKGYPFWTGMMSSLGTRLSYLAVAHALTSGDPSDPYYNPNHDAYLSNANLRGAKDIVLQLCAWNAYRDDGIPWGLWTDPDYAQASNYYPHSCLDTCHILQPVAFFYDVCYDALTPAERDTIRTAMLEKAIQPSFTDMSDLRFTSQGWPNGFAVVNAGLGFGALAIYDPADAVIRSYVDLARTNLDSFRASQGPGGSCYEGHLYGAFATDKATPFWEVDKRITGNESRDAWLNALPEFAAGGMSSLSLAGYGGIGLVNFGDSSAAAYFSSTCHNLVALNGNPTAAWYLKTSGSAGSVGPFTFLFFKPGNPVEPTWASCAYPEVGHINLRDGWTDHPVVHFRCGPPTTNIGHNHFDQNSFLISGFGAWLLPDLGYIQTSFGRYTDGHNSILVDGQKQSCKYGGYLSASFFGRGIDYVKGNAVPAYGSLLTRFDRSILFIKPYYVLVHDELNSSTDRTYTFLLHQGTGGGSLSRNGEIYTVAKSGMGGQVRAQLFANTPIAHDPMQIDPWNGDASLGWYARVRNAAPAREVRFSTPIQIMRGDPVANAGFESTYQSGGYDNWWDWTVRGYDYAKAACTTDTTEKHSGDRSLKMHFTSASTTYILCPYIRVTPGSQITASAWLKMQNVTGTGAGIGFYFYNNNTYTSNVATYRTGTADWSEFTASWTVPADSNQARLILYLNGAGTCWWDDTCMADEVMAGTMGLANPGFEDVSWLGWSARGLTGPSHHISTEIAHSGSKSASIALSRMDSGRFLSEWQSVNPGDNLQASVWLRCSLVKGQGARIRILAYDSDHKFISCAAESEPMLGTLDWRKQTVTGMVPAGAACVRIALELEGQGTVWFDDVALQILNGRANLPEQAVFKSIADGKGSCISTSYDTCTVVVDPAHAVGSMVTYPAAANALISISTDAEVAVIHETAVGEPLRILCIDGRLFTRNGTETIFTASSSGKFEVSCEDNGTSIYLTVGDSENRTYSLRAPRASSLYINGLPVSFTRNGGRISFTH